MQRGVNQQNLFRKVGQDDKTKDYNHCQLQKYLED